MLNIWSLIIMSSRESMSRFKILCIATICFSSSSFASIPSPKTVEVFTTNETVSSVVNVKPNSKGLVVNVIDKIDVLSEQATASIPKYDPKRFGSFQNYKRFAKERVIEWAKENKEAFKNTTTGITSAMNYELKSVPAVVINGEYVVYGDTVSNAVRKWRKNVGRNNV